MSIFGGNIRFICSSVMSPSKVIKFADLYEKSKTATIQSPWEVSLDFPWGARESPKTVQLCLGNHKIEIWLDNGGDLIFNPFKGTYCQKSYSWYVAMYCFIPWRRRSYAYNHSMVYGKCLSARYIYTLYHFFKYLAYRHLPQNIFSFL